MKEIPLTRGYVALIDDDDYERVACHKWSAIVIKASLHGKQVYACRKKEGKFVLLHRELLNLCDSMIQVDHRDHDGLNCQRGNLRVATHSNNMCNRRIGKRNTSGFKGVSWSKQKNKWHARIVVNYKTIHLGFYDSLESARIAYDNATARHHGEFACVNEGAA